MNKQQLGKFLATLNLSPAPVHREGWVVLSCPLAKWRHPKGTDKNPSFGFRVESGESFGSCFSCDWHGSQTEMVQELARLCQQDGDLRDFMGALALIMQAEEQAPLELDDTPDIITMLEMGKQEHIFPEWWLDSFDRAYHDGMVHPYLEGRHVPFAVAERLDLRFDAHRNRVGFPVRDFKGRLRGLHGRSVTDPPATPTYMMYLHENMNNPEVWLGEHWVDLDRPVVFAESVFDLARVLQVYDNVVTPLTASISEEKIRRMPALEVVTLFDPDAAGKKAADKVRHTLKDSVVHIVNLPDGNDAGDSSPYVIADVLKKYVEIDKILV